ncbi:unnamed protein product [Peniophora sp. CBMAI 1063]|nr:unnamed protein product [Peniophora sp. CBMAI 1063]
MLKPFTSTGRKLQHATLPIFRPRSGDRPPTADVAAHGVASDAKRPRCPSITRAASKLSPRCSEFLFHSRRCSLRPRYRALIVGITYTAPECRELDLSPLVGCRNDAYNFARLLRATYGWSDVTIMTDEEENREGGLWPSRDNMIARLHELVAGAGPGDMLAFYYAGHSGQVQAVRDIHEEDGRDEYMVPVDGKTILDDLLREILVEPLCNGARLTSVFDSCHSGTMLDLRLYPTLSRMSDMTHERTSQSDIESSSAIRHNSLPTPIAVFWAAAESMRKFPWGAVKALARLHVLRTRNARLRNTGSVDQPQALTESTDCLPIITVNDARMDDSAVEVPLTGNFAMSDTSSLSTDNASSALNSVLYYEPKTFVHNVHGSGGGASTTCKRCRLLAKRHPIVTSISACQDNQESFEDTRKAASIMTPALVQLLEKEPDLSARQIQKRLQPELSDACYSLVSRKLKRLRRRAHKAKNEEKNMWIGRLSEAVKSIPWQNLQSGSEEDQHLDEPVLLCAPGFQVKRDRR